MFYSLREGVRRDVAFPQLTDIPESHLRPEAYKCQQKQNPANISSARFAVFLVWWREADLNHRPSGYEPDELPGCSIPRRRHSC